MKVLVIGAAIIDIIMEIKSLPSKGDDIFCNNTSSNVGGCAYNVAATLRNFDVAHDLFVPVGEGIYSNIIKNDLEKNGYTIFAKNENQDNGYCLCLVENDGERTFITTNGCESTFNESWFNALNTDDYNMIYVTGYQTLSESGKIISGFLKSQTDKQIFFAPGPVFSSIEKDTINAIFSCKPIVHLNEKEITEYFNDKNIESCIKKLYIISSNTVIVTLGENGTMFYDGHNIEHIKTSKITVVDTIGAGDSHIGTVISELSKGHSLKDAVILANKVAGCVVSVKGAVIDKELLFNFGGL